MGANFKAVFKPWESRRSLKRTIFNWKDKTARLCRWIYSIFKVVIFYKH